MPKRCPKNQIGHETVKNGPSGAENLTKTIASVRAWIWNRQKVPLTVKKNRTLTKRFSEFLMMSNCLYIIFYYGNKWETAISIHVLTYPQALLVQEKKSNLLFFYFFSVDACWKWNRPWRGQKRVEMSNRIAKIDRLELIKKLESTKNTRICVKCIKDADFHIENPEK